MNNLENIKDEAIKRAFPELAEGTITIQYKRMKTTYFKFDRVKKRVYHIKVDWSLRKAPEKVVIGGLAHELGHISLDSSRGQLAHRLDNILYSLFSPYETWDERRTDTLVFQRGLGRELLRFLEYANKRREKFTKKDGLTVKELRRMLND